VAGRRKARILSKITLVFDAQKTTRRQGDLTELLILSVACILGNRDRKAEKIVIQLDGGCEGTKLLAE